MKATIVDLRYKMKDVLKALGRNERVSVLYHGKIRGIIVPHGKKKNDTIVNHAFFGMNKKNKMSVEKQMQKIRGSRYNAV